MLLVTRAQVAGSSADLVVLPLLCLVGIAAWAHRRAAESRESDRRAEVSDLARILHGFSRAESPDEIVDAILRELGHGTGADHMVVVRRRRDAPLLDATLVSMNGTGGPSSSALLSAADLDPGPVPSDAGVGIAVGPGRPVRPGVGAVQTSRHLAGAATELPRPALVGATAGASAAGPDPLATARVIADRLEHRVRRAFGLKHTLAVPLVTRDAVLGAIVISRRRPDPWPDSARRMLEVASVEAAAALSRAYSHRDAEARAATDPLTGLPNRRYFEEFVDLMRRGRRADDAVGILMVDIDRFKALNDRHGHATGDRVLREVGQTIAGAIREVDVPARFGGEEFVVLLRNPSEGVALEVGERIRSSVARIDLTRLGVAGVTVSVGASIARQDGEQIATLIERADHALYRAKRFGRNRVEAA